MKRSKCTVQVKASKQKKINMEADNQNNIMGDLIRAAECIVFLDKPRDRSIVAKMAILYVTAVKQS